MTETGEQEKTSLSPTTKTSVAKAYAARSPTSGMAPFTIRRREPRPQDLQIDILYCGVCILICTKSETNGRTRCRRFIPVFPGTRSSAGW